MPTPPVTTERRRRRSEDPQQALGLQLDAVRAEGAFEAVVLVDGSGCVLAAAGALPLCDEIAAYAPLFGRRTTFASPELEARVTTLARDVEVRRLDVDGTEVMLCAHGPRRTSRPTPLARGLRGCGRILGVEA